MSNDVWIDDSGPVPSLADGPRLLAALPCEDGAASVAVGDGRATLQRIFYDLYADGFPAAFDRLNVATIWMGGEGEHTVGARLSGPDGDVLVEVEMDYVAQPVPATALYRTVQYGAVRLFHLSSDGVMTLALPAPGRYSVDVLLNGVPVQTFPLFVVDGRRDDGTD